MAIEVIAPAEGHPFGEVRYSGLVTDEQVGESVAQLVGIASETGVWRVLTDCREMVWTPTLSDVSAAVDTIAQVVAPEYREALVLPIDVSARVSATHYVTVAANRRLDVRAFSTRDEAITWLTSQS